MQAHIPGSEYIGAGSDSQGIESLRRRVKPLPRKTFIVLYCGCCPWSHCPNVQPAYNELHKAGFTNVKVLYIADNFGTDWVYKGYPTIKGQ
jgi:rhodanese-related sulfurtransferase